MVNIICLLLTFSLLTNALQQNFSLLINFTCAVAKDELEKNPEMRTIAMVELENNFPTELSRKVLKCLPQDVAKIILNPHTFTYLNNSMTLAKETFVIFMADKVEWSQIFLDRSSQFKVIFFPIISHLSKFLVLSNSKEFLSAFKYRLNVAQIYEENRKVIARTFDRTKDLTTFETFEDSNRENLSQILFPDKSKNLNGQTFYIIFADRVDVFLIDGKVYSKWNYFIEAIAKRLNASLHYLKIPYDATNYEKYYENEKKYIDSAINRGLLDFYLNSEFKSELESYFYEEMCFLVPLPQKYSIVELILFLPMDKSCWMWLGITIAVSTLVWRISEGHWNFFFTAFGYFVGQSTSIKTSRLMLKILLQFFIFSIFIFSNGYQSLVTSFMLKPVQQEVSKSIDELFVSGIKIAKSFFLETTFMENENYQKAELVDMLNISYDGNSWMKAYAENKIAIVQPCVSHRYYIEKHGDEKSWRGMYQILEVAFAMRQDLFVLPLHPYIDKFQELMNICFEAGLPKVWERKFMEAFKVRMRNVTKVVRSEEKQILDFMSIAPVFLILVFGLGAALLTFLLEIFHNDFVSELSMEYFKKKLRKFLTGERKQVKVKVRSRKVKMKVRKVQVRPRRNEVEPLQLL